MDTHEQTTVESNPGALTTPAYPPEQEELPALLHPGDMVGKYEIQSQIGKGGMGVVFRAHDTVLKRAAAIKFILGADSDKMRTRLRREAETLARLSHTNIPKIWESDHDSMGRLYVAMEYIDGWTMSEWLKQDPDIKAVLQVFVAAGRALAAAHDARIIHRDFKPDNVLIDKNQHPWVVDFGLTRKSDEVGNIFESIEKIGSTHGNLTQPGAQPGTTSYMAPELFEAQPVARGNTKSDQFAFCVSLYEALYGQRPFPGRNRAETIKSIATLTIKVPPKDGRLSGKVPRKIWRLIRRGLARKPADRFASMHEINAVLAEALEPTPPWKLYGGALLVTLGVVASALVVQARRQQWQSFERDCLLPARTAYIRGNPEAAKLAIDSPACEEAAPRSFHVEGSARALRSMALLFNDSEIEAVHAQDMSNSTWRPTADDQLAALLDELMAIDGLVTSGDDPRVERVQQLAARRSELLDALARIEASPQDRVTAPYMNLVLQVILREELRFDPALDAALERAIAIVRGPSNEPAFFLVFAKQHLQADDLVAANELQEYTEQAAEVSELRELLWSLRAFRLTLSALRTPDQVELREQARAALIRPGSDRALDPRLRLASARVELAQLIVDVLDGEHPTQTQLDNVAQWADVLWWDARYTDAADQLLTQVAERKQRSQLVADIYALADRVRTESAPVPELRGDVAELRARARALGLPLEAAELVILEWSDAMNDARELLESAREVDATQLDDAITKLERFSEREDLDDVRVASNDTMAKLEARASAWVVVTADPTAPSKRHKAAVERDKLVLFFPGSEFSKAIFQVRGHPEFTVPSKTKISLPGAKHDVRCREAGTSDHEWSRWAFFESNGELELECTSDGVVRHR